MLKSYYFKVCQSLLLWSTSIVEPTEAAVQQLSPRVATYLSIYTGGRSVSALTAEEVRRGAPLLAANTMARSAGAAGACGGAGRVGRAWGDM